VIDHFSQRRAEILALMGSRGETSARAAQVATLETRRGKEYGVPAAATTAMVDLVYVTRLQLRLAYDVAVLYRIPLDLDDPDDLWKLIRVALMIKGGEMVREGALKVVPAIVRPVVKRYYSGPVLNAAKGLPVVGKYLLQRNAIKVGIPLVGVPVAVVLNRYTTLVAGRHAEPSPVTRRG